jgi:F0F1-type ATP synthase membrane subunit b/b'
METLLAIFEQLKINSSVLPQFIIITVVYFISRFIFLGKLQNILETREENTVKAESGAEDMLTKVDEMSKKYKSQIDDANKKAKSFVLDRKSSITSDLDKKYKTLENEISSYMEKSRNEIKENYKTKKAEVLSDADGLSDLLVSKITKK